MLTCSYDTGRNTTGTAFVELALVLALFVLALFPMLLVKIYTNQQRMKNWIRLNMHKKTMDRVNFSLATEKSRNLLQ